jgi:hypothetical protein
MLWLSERKVRANVRFRTGGLSGPASAFVQRQEMQWTKRGVHLLVQTRIRTLDGTFRTLFEKWYRG